MVLPEVSVDVTCMTQPSTVSSILSKSISVRKAPGSGVTVLHGKETVAGSELVTSIACFLPLIVF